MEAVTWAESTVVQAVLALAGELAEHLVDADGVARRRRRLQATAAATRQAPGAGAQGARLPAHPRAAAAAGRALRRAKRERELLDFGDVVALAAELARDRPEVGEVERAASRVVLLDEYQDTGAAQEVLLSRLFGDGHPVTAVGDPCQSIYGWRGASAGTLRRFPTRFGAPSRPRRARCAPPTAAAAGCSSSPTSSRASCAPRASRCPQLRPAPGRERDGAVRAALLTDVAAEADWVADQVVAARAALPAGDGPTGRGPPCCAASGRCSAGCARPSRRAACRSRSSASADC